MGVVAQSMAITRFLAAEFGLKGKNNLESAHIDEIVDTIEDVINVAIKTHFETDPAKKAETIAQLNKSTILPMLANIEKRLASRGGQFPRWQRSFTGRYPPFLFLFRVHYPTTSQQHSQDCQ